MIPLYKPFIPAELPELDRILHSGALAYGSYGRQFEQMLSSYLDTSNVVLVSSFNSAILVTLITLDVKPGDEIIASPMACLASNQPLVTVGANVIWADTDPDTGTLDPDSVRSRITSRTKAIFHNHFCGYPGYIDEINAIGKEYGIPVVDDAIEAFGSEYKGRKIGVTGTDVTVFSFQAVRIPTTIDGGAIVFRNRELYEKSILVRDSGVDRRFFRDSQGEINPRCDITVAGFGATMSDVNSYIGTLQMNTVERLIEMQRANSHAWDSLLADIDESIKPLNLRKDTLPNYWVYGILSETKNAALDYFRSIGYYASGVHVPNNNYSIFGKQGPLPGVDKFYSRFLALPCGWWFSVKESETYVQAFAHSSL
ncbi:MAG TPA: aminotransferase class V-fold PLP-dependent enzyme [Bacteroidales bacterium]|nr:aminotransferase class V-fold PLP-dependent enzyme [Bacteroidales bacterium]